MSTKLLKVLSLGLVATLMVGCGTKKGGNSSGNSSGSDSSSLPPAGPDWKDAEKALMEEWCGEVLPYVQLANGYKVEELEDDYGELFLKIYDQSSSFTLGNYQSALEDAGWDVYEGDDENDFYGSKRSDDDTRIYKLNYYFGEDWGMDCGNSIDCWYVDLETELTDDTEWNAEVSEAMLETLTEELPFMAFGKDYELYGAEGDQFMLYDSYYESLVENYIGVLTSNGYTLDGTDEDGDSIYSKTLADQSKVSVVAYYSDGNYLYAYYTPHKDGGTDWPTSMIEPFEVASGYTIPTFEASLYTWYIKNGVLYLDGVTDESLSADFLSESLANGFINPSSGYLTTWEENLAVEYYESGSDTAVTGFSIVVYESEASSSFSATWPETAINTYLASIEVSVAPLAAIDLHNKEFKYYEITYDEAYEQAFYEYYNYYYIFVEYGLMTEEELIEEATAYAEEYASANAGFYVEVYSLDGDGVDNYLDILDDAVWYVEEESEESEWRYAEDPTGALGVYFVDTGYSLLINPVKGSGDEHVPSLTLDRPTANVAPGESITLVATKSMIKDDVVWESSNEDVATVDENGKVDVNSEAALDTKVTITASAGGKTAQCIITVKQTVTVTIGASDCPTKYDETATARTIKGLNFMVCNVMNQAGNVQFKKNSTNLYNSTAFDPIESITFVGASKTATDTTFSVYAGSSASELEKVNAVQDGDDLVYNLNGATFFKVENGKGVFTCTSIVFTF